ncbi:hypothetical protein P43SY_002197 [Pythium insidiosum]|uniref:Intraflagellar transport protein 56 n=1 Tax=Pythium insidiosum TaxID=114742 RepID=A0AAD5QEU8_PYTIN|nr:hypothetical protein P43SY_002197 [Pythium insidiosum]
MYVARRSSNGGSASAKPPSSRARPNVAANPSEGLGFDAFLQRRDYVGALTLLRLEDRELFASQLKRNTSDGTYRLWWTAYCHFQLGAYAEALDTYEKLLESPPSDVDPQTRERDQWRLSRACCLYLLGRYEDAEREALLSTRDPLCTRLLYVLAHRRGNGDQVLLDRYQRLSSESLEDQLALAFTSFVSRNFQDAVDIYKKQLLQHRDRATALHVYLAMCYFSMDYNDVSLELLAVYLETHPDSFVARNLKASNQFRLYSGVEAAEELESFRQRFPSHPCTQEGTLLQAEDMGIRSMYRHNKAIFAEAISSAQRVEGAPVTTALLSPLVDHIPEARMNLVLSFLHRHEYREAFALMEDQEPVTPLEHIVKGVLHAMIGEQTGSKEHIFLAEKYLHAVGSSPQECDTIPGRQSMASYFLLRKEFPEANVYLSSIATYLISNDAFNYNYGVSLAASGQFQEAEDVLLRVQSPKLRKSLVYTSWLARSYIRNTRNAHQAWELYLKMDDTADAFKLLQLIANEYYRSRAFFLAVKSFDVLERLDPDPEYWEAKRGACLGYFQQLACGEEPMNLARAEEVLRLLMASKNVVESNRLGTMLRKWLQSVPSSR